MLLLVLIKLFNMANFDIAFRRIINAEGGYVNDPDDKGKETYMGISRVYHSKEVMWSVIDVMKKRHSGSVLNHVLKQSSVVQNNVKDIYKKEYWDILHLDDINNQRIANEIFDDAVNRGVKSAVKIVQKLLNMPINGKIDSVLINKLKEF